MEYLVDKQRLMALLKEEVSREAAIAVDKEGNPLYDRLRPVSRDAGDFLRYIDDALHGVAARFWDVCTAMPGCAGFVFHLPDMDSSNWDGARRELDRYAVLSATAAFLLEKDSGKSEEFNGRAGAALDKADIMMRARMRV